MKWSSLNDVTQLIVYPRFRYKGCCTQKIRDPLAYPDFIYFIQNYLSRTTLLT